jgi:pimeloyl-ACP methyl ester carboxylesterase
MTDPLPVIELQNLSRLAGGRQVEWESVGQGRPLVWVEGGPGFPAHLGRPDVELLSRWFTCVLINAPGCGRTSAPLDGQGGYSLPSHVEFFEEVRTALGLGRVALAGHSWGGLVASAWAATYPRSVGRLLVFDGYAGGGSVAETAATAERDTVLDRIRDRPWFDDAVGALERVLGMDSPTEQELCHGFSPVWPLYFADPDSVIARAHTERLRRELRWNVAVAQVWDRDYEALDYRELIAGVECPTLIVVGKQDFVCGPTWNRALAAVIADARYLEIADAGHFPQYEQPKGVTIAIEEWLGSVGVAAG